MRFQRHHFEHKQTIITFLCGERFLDAAKKAVLKIRRDLECYIHDHPEFETSHTPLIPCSRSPDIIQRMCMASTKVGIGPMASVAGAVAEAAVTAILEAGSKEAVVDNGGDIALYIREPIRIGIFSGFGGVHNLALEVEPSESSFGICTSSGTVGHSFSYGKADAALVVSEDILLADAAATALGNRIHGVSDIKQAFDPFTSIREIEGAMAIFGQRIGIWGSLPKLTKARVDIELITKGR